MRAGVTTLKFPSGGLYRRLGFQRQSPYTTPDCNNVFADDPLTGRERGGQRPALARQFAQQLTGEVRGVFTLRYYDDGAIGTQLIAFTEGELWRLNSSGQMEKLTTALTLNPAVQLQAAELNGKLYIADYGDRVVAGSDGARGTTAAKFDATSVSDWTAEGIDADDMVLVIYNSTDNDELFNGTYEISSIASGELTLATNCNDGAGSAAADFYIARCPKIYDPIADTLTRWVATTGKGQVPTGCPLICNWRGRISLAGEAESPQAWFMSRQLDPLDWDYFPLESEDPGRAVSASNSDAGQTAEPVTALIPHSDDCLIFGCTNSLWIMRGDPAFGGEMDNLSRDIGVVDRDAWCYTPEGYLFFLTLDGVYLMSPGCGSTPRSVSRELLPEELIAVPAASFFVSMAYDTRLRCIHLAVTSATAASSSYWLLDVKQTLGSDQSTTVSFWPVSFADNHQPFSLHARRSIASEHSVVIYGGRDGYLRHMRTDKNQDDQGEGEGGVDQVPIASYLIYGPLTIGGGDGYLAGAIHEIIGEVAADGGDVDWSLRMGDNAEGAFAVTTPQANGTWSAGVSASDYPRVRGSACCLKLENGQSARWSVENIHLGVKAAGRRRTI